MVSIINFNSPQLTFSITFSSGPNSEGWLNSCYVAVDATSFSGSFSCDILIDDILVFYRELSVMQEQSRERRNQKITAEFQSVEQDIQITFEMTVLGKISGKYILGNSACFLQGGFEIDQSYLPPFLLNIKNALNLLQE